MQKAIDPPALIEFKGRNEGLWGGRCGRARACRGEPQDSAVRVRGHHGPIRLRQIDGHEYHWVSGYADLGIVFLQGL